MRKKRILLVGYYGEGNLGDDAILSSFLERFPRERFSPVTVSGRGRKFRLLLRLPFVYAVVFVGGNLFQSTTSRRSLFYYRAVFRLGKALGKKCLLFGGIGDFGRPSDRRRMVRTLGRADGLFLRSAADCRAFEGRTHPAFYPDHALFLPCKPGKKENAALFVFRPGNFLFHAFLIRQARGLGYAPLLVSLSREDGTAQKRLAGAMNCPLFSPVDYAEAVDAFSGAAFAVSERYHGGVFAFLGCTPVALSLSSSKNRGLWQTVQAAGRKIGVAAPVLGYTEGNAPALLSKMHKKIGDFTVSDFEKIRNSVLGEYRGTLGDLMRSCLPS